jgi:hypothetical protein
VPDQDQGSFAQSLFGQQTGKDVRRPVGEVRIAEPRQREIGAS